MVSTLRENRKQCLSARVYPNEVYGRPRENVPVSLVHKIQQQCL